MRSGEEQDERGSPFSAQRLFLAFLPSATCSSFCFLSPPALCHARPFGSRTISLLLTHLTSAPFKFASISSPTALFTLPLELQDDRFRVYRILGRREDQGPFPSQGQSRSLHAGSPPAHLSPRLQHRTRTNSNRETVSIQ
jgi:hypothetical protein